MLHLISSVWSSMTEQPETRVVVLGDANVGKSALFERLKLILADASAAPASSSSGVSSSGSGPPPPAPLPRFTTPTVGLNTSRADCVISGSGRRVRALLWDVGGDVALRPLWLTYMTRCHGVIYVMDLSASRDEQTRQAQLLRLLMRRPELAFAPFLIVGTKLDRVVAATKCATSTTATTESSSPASSSPATVAGGNEQQHQQQQQRDAKHFLQGATAQLMRTLEFESLAAASTAHDGAAAAVAAAPPPTASGAPAATTISGGGQDADEFGDAGFVPVTVDSLLAADAADAVDAVPGGSVSGIAGHLYHVVCASAVTRDGADLHNALHWILSAAASSRARAAVLESLAANE